MKIDIGEVLTEGIVIPIKNPVIFVPAVISALLGLSMHLIPEPSSYSTSASMSYLLILTLWLLVFFAISIFLNNMIIKMVYDATQKKLSLFNAFKTAAMKYPYVILATILEFIITCGGLVFLIVPGIFLSVALLYYNHAIIVDNKGVVDSLKYSWHIIKNNWWLSFALLLICFIPYFVFVGVNIVIGLVIKPLAILFEFLLAICFVSWYNSIIIIAYLQLTDRKIQK